MKIKTDFVTNSSSTCYVVMAKDEFTLEAFIKGCGISDTSVFQPMFEQLFNNLSSNLVPLDEGVKDHRWNKDCLSAEEFITKTFSIETWERIESAKSKGFDVYLGELSSGYTEIENFFCTSDFLIESDNLIVDGTNDSW